MDVDKIILQLGVLEELHSELELQLVVCAGEWYRQQSGRKHFHQLEFKGRGDDTLMFTTWTRSGDEEIEVPCSWFAESV